ncbi:hypothetical protein [Amycolatopsis dendrobii]|uniref:Uncharacterized protein n=1 Tax=Amycolatopsis dendrobii TaxID=2760662 RepID=A0A7W3ZGG5_9PSEU|nr:hypothetical protein [Amycolatopsis dendrobii]MBB1160123.1 hypothetical protein [Amycolatopsis dendrobii]
MSELGESRSRLSRVAYAFGIGAAIIAVLVAWCVGANYLAQLTAGEQLTCRLSELVPWSGLGVTLWQISSLVLFLLAGAGISALLGRIGLRKATLGVCAALVVLFTWGYVAATHVAMQKVADHGTSVAMPTTPGSPRPADRCQGL